MTQLRPGAAKINKSIINKNINKYLKKKKKKVSSLIGLGECGPDDTSISDFWPSELYGSALLLA